MQGDPATFLPFCPVPRPPTHRSGSIVSRFLIRERVEAELPPTASEVGLGETPMKVRPHSRAVVKRIEAEDKTANGIIISPNAGNK